MQRRRVRGPHGLRDQLRRRGARDAGEPQRLGDGRHLTGLLCRRDPQAARLLHRVGDAQLPGERDHGLQLEADGGEQLGGPVIAQPGGQLDRIERAVGHREPAVSAARAGRRGAGIENHGAHPVLQQPPGARAAGDPRADHADVGGQRRVQCREPATGVLLLPERWGVHSGSQPTITRSAC